MSVLIPAYNVGASVGEQLQCVLAQDFADKEVLVCDDASTDDTWRVLCRFRRHPAVRLLRLRGRVPVGAVRNRLLREARGEYVMPCDADDWLLQGAISTLVSALDREPAVGYVYGSYLMLETRLDGGLIRPPWVRGAPHDPKSDLVQFTANHAGSLMRRRLALAVGGYDEDTPLDSVSLCLKLAERTRLRHLAGQLTYVYRRRARAQEPDWAEAFLVQIRRAMARRARDAA